MNAIIEAPEVAREYPVQAAQITQSRLKELLHYDPQTGAFTRVRQASNVRPGTVAGSKYGCGHLKMMLDGRQYLAHRLAWLYIFGAFPDGQIDHINGVGDDNRIANLRDVSMTINAENRRHAFRNNRIGILGVSPRKNGRWTAQIQVNGRKIHLGYFDAAEAASAAYVEAKRKLHGGCTL